MRATYLLCIVSSKTNRIINTPWAAAPWMFAMFGERIHNAAAANHGWSTLL